MNVKKKIFPLSVYGIIIVAMIGIIAVLSWLIKLGYTQDWTGFNVTPDSNGGFRPGKYLWDWLELMIVPLVLIIIGLIFNISQRKNEQEIATKEREKDRDIALDRLRQEAFQQYLDRMTELLINGKIKSSGAKREMISVGRSRTLTILEMLDGERKGSVIRFLNEAGLINVSSPIINLSQANFSFSNIEKTNLTLVSLRNANISNSNLMSSNLSGSDLSNLDIRNSDLSKIGLVQSQLRNAKMQKSRLFRANLTDADLEFADLSESNLELAYLLRANLRAANLSKANLRNANLENTNLQYTRFESSILQGANFTNAIMIGAKLQNADLTDAILDNADLSMCNLVGAKVTQKQLQRVRSLAFTVLSEMTQITIS